MHDVPVAWLGVQLGAERLKRVVTGVGFLLGLSLGCFWLLLGRRNTAKVQLEIVLGPALGSSGAKVEVDVDIVLAARRITT